MKKYPIQSALLAAAFSTAFAGAASSEVLTPTNGSFESPDTTDFTQNVDDWTTFGPSDRTITQAGALTNQDGDQHLVLDDRASGEVGVFQNLGSIEAGFTYTLELKVGRGGNDIPGTFSYGLYTGTTNGGFNPGNAVVTENQGTVFETGTVSTAINASPNVFLDRTLTFDTLDGNNAALVGQDLFIRAAITGGSGPGNADQLFIDDITVTAAVPEPGSLAIAALGSLALLGRRRSVSK